MEGGRLVKNRYVLQVMSFGASCSPASAQYVKNLNAREHIEKYPRAEKAIRENHYVDDWLESFHTEEEARKVAKDVKYVHSKGGLEIRNWISNSIKVTSSLGENYSENEKMNFERSETKTERILAVWWRVIQDMFTYSV